VVILPLREHKYNGQQDRVNSESRLGLKAVISYIK